MSAARELPPAERGAAARRMTQAAAEGRFELPHCEDCGAVHYPPRERCMRCLSARLRWAVTDPNGTLLAGTSILHSNEAWFRSRVPVRIGSVRLDAGPVLIVMVEGEAIAPGGRVRVEARLDAVKQAILVAVPY